MSEFEITTTDGEKVVGPVTLDQIRRGLVAGKIPGDAKARQVGTSEWLPVAVLLASSPLTEAAAPPSASPATSATVTTAARPNVAVGVVALLAVAALGGGAWYFLGRSKPAPSKSATAAKSEVKLDPEQAGVEGFKAYDGKPKDEAKAVRLWKQSCDGGDKLGCTGVGFAEMWGFAGTTKDYAKALEHLEAGCSAGVMRACALVGQMALNGWGGPKDLARGKTFCMKACDGGEPRGCYFLGLAHVAKDVPADWNDPEFGRALLDKACGKGFADACEQTAAMNKKENAERLKAKATITRLGEDDQCVSAGKPRNSREITGGTYDENFEVASAMGCVRLHKYYPQQGHVAVDNWYCCP